jgi:hypothetical protein
LDEEEPLPESIKHMREIMGQLDGTAFGYPRAPRHAGWSSYPLCKMIRFATNAMPFDRLTMT